MYELKKIWKTFTSKFVGTGPSSYKKKHHLPGRGLTKVEKQCPRLTLPRRLWQAVYSRFTSQMLNTVKGQVFQITAMRLVTTCSLADTHGLAVATCCLYFLLQKILLLLTQYSSGDQIEKNEVGEVWGEDRRIQGFGGETWGKETTWKTQA